MKQYFVVLILIFSCSNKSSSNAIQGRYANILSSDGYVVVDIHSDSTANKYLELRGSKSKYNGVWQIVKDSLVINFYEIEYMSGVQQVDKVEKYYINLKDAKLDNLSKLDTSSTFFQKVEKVIIRWGY